MSRVNDVQSAMWGQDDFLDLAAPAKLVYLWTFTNPRCGMSGIYSVSRRIMQLEVGMSRDELERALSELQRHRFLVVADDGTLFVRSRVKHLRTKSTQIAKSIANDVRRLAVDHPVREAFMAEYGEDRDWGKGVLFAQFHGDSLGGSLSVSEPQRGSGTGTGTGTGVKKNQKAGRVGNGEPKPPEPDRLPDDLPDRLKPVAEHVHTTLSRVADAKGAKTPTLAATGRAVAAFPDHDHHRVVGDFEHYWVHGAGAGTKRADIVLTYRRRLENVPASPHAALGAAARHLQPVLSGDALIAAQQRQRAEQAKREQERQQQQAGGAA